MGTRADFYLGKGKDAEWLGSIAWDGSEIDEQIRSCTGPEAYRHAVESFLKERDDATWPKDGWPWPWDDSGTTDCSYWHFDGRTWEAAHGDVYVRCDQPYPHDDEAAEAELLKNSAHIEYPNMKDKQNVTWGKRSGVMVVGLK